MISAAIAFDISRPRPTPERPQHLADTADGLVVISFPLNAAACLVLFATPIETGVPPVMSVLGAVERVVASDAGLVVVTRSDVRVLDPAGRLVRRLFPTDERPRRRRRESDSTSEVSSLPGLASDSDWGASYDPDDIDDADDPRLADETEPQAWDVDDDSRGGSHGSSLASSFASSFGGTGGSLDEFGRVPVVALSADAVSAWIARTDGLWQIDTASGRTMRLLGARRDRVGVLAASADGRSIAAVVGGELLRSIDGGTVFEAVGAFATPPRALAVSSSGSIFVIDRDELRAIPPGDRDFETIGISRALDVSSCGGEMAVLAEGGVFALSGGSSAVRVEHVGAAPAGAKRIACGATGAVRIAYGGGLWTSVDRGRSWSARDDLPPEAINDVAATSAGIWVATPAGLLRLPPTAPPRTFSTEPWKAVAPPQALSRPGIADIPGPARAIWRWWYTGLPRIDVAFTASQTAARRDLRAFVVATFVLSGPSERVRRAVRASRDHHRRIVADRHRMGTAGRPTDGGANDPIAMEERLALARALEDQP